MSNQKPLVSYTSPEPTIGSVWKTITRRHYGQRRKVVGTNKAGTTLHIRSVDKSVAQHSERIYSVSRDVFVREHELVKA
jgi:hypothetical protein